MDQGVADVAGAAPARPDDLAAVRCWLAHRHDVQQTLGGLHDPADFIAALLSALAAAGDPVPRPSADALADGLQPDPLGLSRWHAAPLNPGGWPGPGWLPARSVPNDPTANANSPFAGAPAFDWTWFGDQPLDQPFYEDSVRRAAALPLSRLLRPRTTLAALVDGWRSQTAPVAPAGLVFHLSRCGSTLVARLLQSLPGCHCASEPEPFDAVVQWAMHAPVDDQAKLDALRAMAAALGRNCSAPDSRFFLKLDCWHILSLPLIRAAFPHTPWLFLIRDPLEVAVSQMAMPGLHAVPGLLDPALVGLPGGETLAADDYCARVLGRLCAAAADATDGADGADESGPGQRGLCIDYAELLPAMAHRIPAHFGLALDADSDARAVLAAVLATSSKQPGTAFVADSQKKRAAAPAQLVDLVNTHARPAYDRLKAQLYEKQQ